MSRAGKGGVQPFTRTEARQRLKYGQKCFDVADLINGAAPADPPAAATVAHVPEQGRFDGPAPLYRRGRAYIQELAPAFTLASLGHGATPPRSADSIRHDDDRRSPLVRSPATQGTHEH